MKKKMYFLLLLAFVGFYTNTNAQNISTVAGSGSASPSGDGGLATATRLTGASHVVADASGNLYICTGNRIRKVTASTGIITTVAGTGVVGFLEMEDQQRLHNLMELMELQ